MYSQEDLQAAVSAGVVPAETAEALRVYTAVQRNTQPADEEQFRLLTNFNDIFVVIAIALLFVGSNILIPAPANFIATALVSWALAEFFVRKRGMALPAVVLTVTTIGSAYLFFVTQMVQWVKAPFPIAGAVGGGLAAVLAWLYWRRFRVPIAVSVGALAVMSVFAIPFQEFSQPWMALDRMPNWALITMGFALFSYAMYWDSMDRERKTYRSEIAFWLHLLAAPFVVNPLFSVLGAFERGIDLTRALVIFSIYGFFAAVSVAVDRRALMLSGLVSIVAVVVSLSMASSTGLNQNLGVFLLIVGTLFLLVSAYWKNARIVTLRFLPSAVRRYLPPL